MGQKVHPIGFRVGVTEPWRSRWYAPKKVFGNWLVQDFRIRKFVAGERDLKDAGVSLIEIERMGEGESVSVKIHAARVGLVIGSQGKKIDRLEQEMSRITGVPVNIKVEEVAVPELDPQISSQVLSEELERRSPYRRVIRNMAERIMEQGARGVRIQVKGRLAGAEIARKEAVTRGKIPLSTLRADIRYGTATAILSKGTIGIKVWIYRGDRLTDAAAAPPPGGVREEPPVQRRGPARGRSQGQGG